MGRRHRDEGEPGGDQRCDDRQKAEISEAAVEFFKVRDLRLAGLLALFVLLGRGEAGGRHRGIIAYLLPVVTRFEWNGQIRRIAACGPCVRNQLAVLKEASRRSRTKTMCSRMASRASRLVSFFRA